jgi:hypothetical protein
VPEAVYKHGRGRFACHRRGGLRLRNAARERSVLVRGITMTNDDKIDKVLADLTRERDELDEQVQAMIGDMAAAPEEQRRSGAWAANGASTARYLQLTERLAEVEQAIIDLTRQRAASGPSTMH